MNNVPPAVSPEAPTKVNVLNHVLPLPRSHFISGKNLIYGGFEIIKSFVFKLFSSKSLSLSVRRFNI